MLLSRTRTRSRHPIQSAVLAAALTGAAVLAGTPAAKASVFDVFVGGGDAIFLAGRTDLAIPPASQPWGDNNPGTEDGMRRHSGPTPEEILESVPPSIAVSGGDVVKVLDPAIGGIEFFNGFGPPFFGPEGAGSLASSNITAFGGISGYRGSQGALTGVFLNDDVPSAANGAPPPTLDFLTIGRDFASLSPLLGQVFYIGDGQTAGGAFHEFVAPAGATRLFFGVPDAFSFNGVPGAYDDNDGGYRIRVGVNTTPTPPAVPLPAPALLLLAGLGGLVALRRRA
jgi:hypothetical protein